ncbi:hypothetical protein EGW08_008464 [Elysia chlorotica]|uniref:Uncharacterized protein n=1 Tax=Elysia chlorotica TaxID=188477 RepID=A0A433TQI4_ELYCH|nr:hypothetical protein EGW08_008464 [Elysia chlorotica]
MSAHSDLKMFTSSVRTLLFLLVLVASIEVTEAQIPKFLCDIVKFLLKPVTGVTMKPHNILPIFLLLALSIQGTQAQMPSWICNIFKVIGWIVLGCPNEGLLCLLLGVYFGLFCDVDPYCEMKPQSFLLFLLLAASLQVCEAQWPSWLCDIFEILGRIVIGCPNQSLLCLLAEIFFGLLCGNNPTVFFRHVASSGSQAVSAECPVADCSSR